MRYLALIYSDESVWETLDDGKRAEWMGRYSEFAGAARTAGVMTGGDELASTRDATTVRVRDGQTLVVDGPYAEVREALGGYFLLECGSLDEACDWAARIPGAEYGAVEVRAVHDDPEEVQL